MDPIITTMVAAILAALVAVVGFVGARLFNKIDELFKLLRVIETGLNNRLNDHDVRLVRIETNCKHCRSI